MPAISTLPPLPETGATVRLARLVLAHRRLILLLWVLLLPAGIYGASHVSKRLKLDFSLPGQPGYETAKKITHLYGNGGDTNPAVVLVSLPAGQVVTREQSGLKAAFDRARAAVPGARIVDYGATRDSRFITGGGRATFALVFTPIEKTFGAPKIPVQVEHALSAALPGSHVGLTGLQQLANGGSSKGPGVLVETLIGAAGSLAVLAFVFASMLAFVPLLIAAVSILTTLLVVLGLTYVCGRLVHRAVPGVAGRARRGHRLLAAARHALARGACAWRDNHEAVIASMATAGRAVAALRPDRRDRPAGADRAARARSAKRRLRRDADPAVSTGVALTLLPALLGGIGPRVDWPRIRQESRASRGWTAWARGVVRRPRSGGSARADLVGGAHHSGLQPYNVGETSARALRQERPARTTPTSSCWPAASPAGC